MPKKNDAPNPYATIELMHKAVDDHLKEIERHGYRINKPEDLHIFVSLMRINHSISQAMLSDLKSRDALIQGLMQLRK